MKPLSAIISLFAILSFPGLSQAGAANKIFINTPSLCHSLDRIEGNRVYLISPESACNRSGLGKLAVDINASSKTVEIFTNGKLWKTESVISLDIDIEAVQDVSDKSKKRAGNIELPRNRYEDLGREKAREMANSFYSDDYQNRIKAETERLKKTVFGPQFQQEIAKQAEQYDSRQAMPGRLAPNERLYIFISSSVPLHVLRNYAADADRVKDTNIVFVLRGFVNGMKYVKPTRDFVSSMLKRSPDCDTSGGVCDSFSVSLQIDPALFSRYGISEVPAFVYVPNIQTIDFDTSEGELNQRYC